MCIHDRIVMIIVIYNGGVSHQLSGCCGARTNDRPDFRQFTLVQDKKQRFFEYLTPRL